MNDAQQMEFNQTLWRLISTLREGMNADHFRDYIFALFFVRNLSDNYEEVAKKVLESDYSQYETQTSSTEEDRAKVMTLTPLSAWYVRNEEKVEWFEEQMYKELGYAIKPNVLWSNICVVASTQNDNVLKTLQASFTYIENELCSGAFQGLFSEINLDSYTLGKDPKARNSKMSAMITKIDEELSSSTNKSDLLQNTYEYVISQFASSSGKNSGESYTPRQISTILSRIAVLDSKDPRRGKKTKINNVLDFACGSASLLINVKEHFEENTIYQIYGQELNKKTYNLARMNMLLHGFKASEFQIFHEDSLLNGTNLAKGITFDVIVSNPPFNARWEPDKVSTDDSRFEHYGLSPKSTADLAFLLHGLHFLSDIGTMAIILTQGALYRGGTEEKIRMKLIEDGKIDAVIGLPSNLFPSTGIPACILVLKKCKTFDDILFINASESYKKDGYKNILLPEHIDRIVDTYQFRKENKRFSRCVSIEEIEKNDFNLNISRYVNVIAEDEVIDLLAVKKNLDDTEYAIREAKTRHNQFLKELGLPELA